MEPYSLQPVEWVSFEYLTPFCCAQPYERPPARGIQYFSGVPDEDVVGKPYRHMAADMQVISPSKFHLPKLVLP